ncbi:MAG TPA: EpsI family protein [Myxococcota bacterium]|nr:EpsI family protein [Myxococcota bacterium]
MGTWMGTWAGADAELRWRRWALLIGALAFWRLALWVPERQLTPVDAWLFHTVDPFPQAIFAISAAIAYRRREALRGAMQPRGCGWLAAPPLLLGVALFGWAHFVAATDLQLVSLLLLAPALGSLWHGAPFARALALPLLVLAFAYPLPAVLTNQAFYALRLAVAEHAVWLLQLVGIPALREGNVIYNPRAVVQIVDTCSGLRSIETLSLAALFYVGWFPARRARQVLLVLVAPLIGYLFNLIRICVMTLEPTSEFSAAHTLQGWLVFLGAIACLIAVDRVLGRLLPVRPAADRAERDARAAHPAAPRALRGETAGASEPDGAPIVDPAGSLPNCALSPRVGGARSLALLALAMLGISIGMPRWSPPPTPVLAPLAIPAELAGWERDGSIEVDGAYFWTVHFVRSDYVRYRRAADEISLFVGYDDLLSRGRSLLSPKNALPSRGWEVEQRSRVSIDGIAARVERVVAHSLTSRVVTYHWYEGIDSFALETLRAMFAIEQSPFRRSVLPRVIRVSAVERAASQARERREADLRTFAVAVAELLRAERGADASRALPAAPTGDSALPAGPNIAVGSRAGAGEAEVGNARAAVAVRKRFSARVERPFPKSRGALLQRASR